MLHALAGETQLSLVKMLCHWTPILTNLGGHWFTKSAVGVAHLLYNAAHAQSGWGFPAAAIGFAVFNANALVRLAMDPEHHMAHWTEFKECGHFAAMEAPTQLVNAIRTFFRELRPASRCKSKQYGWFNRVLPSYIWILSRGPARDSMAVVMGR